MLQSNFDNLEIAVSAYTGVRAKPKFRLISFFCTAKQVAVILPDPTVFDYNLCANHKWKSRISNSIGNCLPLIGFYSESISPYLN